MSSGLRPADAHLTGLLSQSIHQPQPGARTTLRAASKGLMLGAVGAAKAMDCFSSVLVFSHWITGPRHPQEAEETGHLLGWGAALFLPLKQSNFSRAMGASVASQNRARPAIAKIIFIHTHTHIHTPAANPGESIFTPRPWPAGWAAEGLPRAGPGRPSPLSEMGDSLATQ